jgi:hypothetical protein
MSQTTADEPAPADLAVWLDGRRRAILKAIRFHDGKTHTLKIREYSGTPRGSFSHHMDLLMDPPENIRAAVDWIGDEGLVEETGEVEIGLTSPAREFALTDAGEKVFEKVINDGGVRASDVRDLKQQVEELEADRAADRERIEELEAENQEIREAFNELRDNVVDGEG